MLRDPVPHPINSLHDQFDHEGPRRLSQELHPAPSTTIGSADHEVSSEVGSDLNPQAPMLFRGQYRRFPLDSRL